jgi:hypothetical protein
MYTFSDQFYQSPKWSLTDKCGDKRVGLGLGKK